MKSSDKHISPGSNAGYSYQFERALLWLSEIPLNYVIGIETSDDVSIEGEGVLKLEQDKHSIQKNHTTYGDRSKDLWNTLMIWLNALDSGEVLIESTEFFMVTNKILSSEYIAYKISLAKDETMAETCVKSLEEAAKNPPKDIVEITRKVLDKNSRNNLLKLISKSTLIDGSKQSSGEELRSKIINNLKLPSWCNDADSIVDELLGWLHKIALTCWQNRQPCLIKSNEFINQKYAVLNLRERKIRREKAENFIPVTNEEIGREKGQPFVKQMYLVTEDDNVIEKVIRDFIRCNIEKMRLSKDGNVTDADWECFASTLQSRWERISAKIIRTSKNTNEKEEDVGFKIYAETTDHREKLAGVDTEQIYLTAGTYHRLANLIQLGWHPNFKKLMNKESE